MISCFLSNELLTLNMRVSNSLLAFGDTKISISDHY